MRQQNSGGYPRKGAGMKCERCGEKNPAEIHTCSPQEPQIKQRTGDCLLTGVCAAEGHHIQKPQRQQRTYTLRKWQGLTDEEIIEFEIWLDDEEEKHGWNPPADIVKYIETKLKEKNT
jgi:hypothetical protein